MHRHLHLSLLVLFAALAGCTSESVILSTASGDLSGYIEDDVEHYLGIPYAQPPVGALRWRAPQAAAPWQGILDATESPESCPQYIPLAGSLLGNEDCLYLNIWTPAERSSEPLPVMVWIHGGGFTAGQGAYSASDGKRLAQQEQVVVVAMNYRLGVFGFLAHPDLSGEDEQHPGSGNYGIQDQTAALRWVQHNIAAFGGDPDQVTIFGQSAGGVSVCTQLVSPLAAGLFHRAAIMSGPCETPLSPLAGAHALGQKLQAGLGCDDAADALDCMRAKDTGEVAAVLPPDPSFAFGEGYTVWWPVLDNHVLPQQPMAAFSSGDFNRVPVINGATRDEATLLLWLSHDMLFKPLKNDQYSARLEYLTGSPELAARVAAQYPLEQYDSAFDTLTAAFSDGFFKCFARHQSQALATQVPAWSYQFNFSDAPFFVPFVTLGAYHGGEIQYLFGAPASLLSSTFSGSHARLSATMMGYWGQFARSGNPNRAGLPPWPEFDQQESSLLLDEPLSMTTAVNAGQCRFWEQLPYLRAPYPAP